MQEKVRVIGIDDEVVFVVPLDVSVCLGCANAECRTGGSVFTALNRRKLDLHVGTEVRVASPLQKQMSQALFSIGIPLGSAITAYCAVFFFYPRAGEGLCAGAALLALVCTSVFLYRISRAVRHDLPEVIEVL